MRATFLSLACAVVTWAQVPAHAPHYPNISNGIVLYGAMHQESQTLWPAINTWLGAHFDWVIGGPGQGVGWQDTGDPHGSNPMKVYWAAYEDMPSERPTEMYDLQATAVRNSFKMERMFLHSSVDMAYPSGMGPTSRTAQFDFMEPYYQNSGNVYQGGVFLYNGSAYTDVTPDTWLGGRITIFNTLCVGFMEPFDQMNVTLATPRVGGTVTYKYWNGITWAPLSMSAPNSDGTSGQTTSGKVYFYPPADWTARTLPVNETTPVVIPVTTSKFWVQIVVSGASTAPAYTTIKGDDWSVSSAGNNFRGWSTTDPHRINVGTRLEYNPNPPANASAKFQYQSRVTYFGQNLAYGNPSDVQGGVRTWGRFLADAIDNHIIGHSLNYDAAFFDDANQIVLPTTPANASRYYDFNQTNGWTAEWALAYAQTISDLKSRHGSSFAVGVNGFIPNTPNGVTTLGDFGFCEASWCAPFTWGPYPTYGYNQTDFYDWALPAHNPNGTKFYFQYFDTWSLGIPWGSTAGIGMSNWHYADRGNRTPMMTLAMHYLGENANSGFMYTGSNASYNSYATVDQVYTYLPATTLAAPVAADITGGSKTITLADATSCGAIIRLGPTTGGDDVYVSTTGVEIYVYGPTDVTAQSLTGTPTTNVMSGTASWVGSSSKFSSLTWGPVTPIAGLSVSWRYWNGGAWAPLTIASDTTAGLKQAGRVSWTPPSDWASTIVSGTTAYYVQWTLTYSLAGQYFSYTSIRSDDWKTFSTTSPIYNSYPSGAPAACIQQQHLATMAEPSASSVYSWTRWFPAMGVDIGTRDPTGLNGGARMVEKPWKTGGAPDYISGQPRSACSPASKCPDVWRRDFTKAIVLFRPWKNTLLESELDTPSQPIALGGTYYPLKADGTLGPGVTSVTLRGGEGAILMKGGNSPAVSCNAGPRQTLRAGFPAQLDGSGSYSADGSALSYLWQQLSGPRMLRWSLRTSTNPNITVGLAGTYEFQLTVTGNAGQSATCTVTDGAVATDNQGVVVTNNATVDALLGPMVRLGANPWPWQDDRDQADADLQMAAMDQYYPAWWDSPGQGTVAVAAGSNAVTGSATSFTTTFCQGPGDPNTPKSDAVIAVWYATGVAGQTGRRMSRVTRCVDDTHLTVDEFWDAGAIPPGSGLSYASDDGSTGYARNWGWGQADLPGNYGDNVAAYYALYYRSGIADYLAAARKLADRYWRSPMVDRGASQTSGHSDAYGFTGRSLSALGLVLRALELQGTDSDMWSGLHTIWDQSMGYLQGARQSAAQGIWDTREAANRLAMVSYCALFDADPAYRSNCKTAISGSFAGVWTPSMAADGSWPTLYYSTSSWDTPGGVSLVNGSISVVGNGAAWTAASFPCTVWFTNDPSGRPADNTAGDATTYTAMFVDATHLNLDRPYQGSSGPHGWALASGGMIGWGAQPASMGILAAAFDLAAKAIADTDPTNSALASSYNLATANWIVAYGYWPLQRGLYAAAQGVNCQAPISDNNTACTGGNLREQARALSADALRGIMATYAFTRRTDLRAFTDALYNAMFAKPGSCPSGSSECSPDGYYLSGLDDGGSMMTAGPPQGNEWFGAFFGVNGSSTWPAYRVGGPEPEGTRALYVTFNAGSVRGAAKVRVTATEPSGRALQTECSSSPCAVAFDGRQGSPMIELNYLSNAGVVLAKTAFPL